MANHGVVAGGDSSWPAESAGPCTDFTYQADVVMRNDHCTFFGHHNGPYHSKLVMIFKLPALWQVGRIYSLRGIYSPNYAFNTLNIYSFSGDDSAYTLDSDGDFNGAAIAWSHVGEYKNSVSGGTGIAGTGCGGGNLASGVTAERLIDNLSFSAKMVKLVMTDGCASTQIAQAQIKMCKTAGDNAC